MNIQPVNILLVEDNEDDILLLEDSLSQGRMLNLIQVVRDGREAMAYLRREAPYTAATRPGLILLDINMPIMNGFEVLEQVKGDPSLRTIPIVMLTTSDQELDIARSYAQGACSFVSKPVDFDDLRKVIHQFELYWTLVSKIPAASMVVH